MKLWTRKIFVVLISVLTLGLYIPPTYIPTNAAENKEVEPQNESDQNLIESEIPEEVTEDVFESQEDYIERITNQAKEQTLTKMGPRIIEKVDQDMTADILPKIEEIVESILEQVEEENLPYYEIKEELRPGYGEKIFNLTNHQTGEEIARFHVRRDKRPGEGYWFNFHYHLKDDNFLNHYSIGEVYWEKNTPPKWMS
ncbi:hypothetical protein EQV77_12545 [Halobacillus fulvus]|nr:hypothetical protein EQV77_12545 [Halobacillus fulvus]